MTKTEEALLPIIAEMKGLIERQERHADEATTHGVLAKYLQIYVTKLEHLPRTPEGREMWAVEGVEEILEIHPRQIDALTIASGDKSLKVVPVIITRKE